MRKCILAAFAATLVGAMCFAETPEPSNFYKLEFVIKEVDGSKVLNSRAYTTTVASQDNRGCSIRTGSKVPVQTSAGHYDQINTGINIDCGQVRETPAGLSLTVTADVSSMPPDSPQGSFPIVRENRWTSSVVVPLKRPTVIFSSDDVTSKHQMQVELTATPVK